MNWLENKKLYLIIDTPYVKPENAVSVCEEMCESGADIIQLRDKNLSDKDKYNLSLEIRKITSKYNIPFIVNDRLDIALSVDADGIHLGQDDLPVPTAREIINRYQKSMIIGLSTHSYDQAIEASKLPIDYLATGPLFPTQTKPDYIPIGLEQAKLVVNEIKDKPVFGIGNINKDTISDVLASGINRIVVVSAILKSENRKESIGFFKKLL